VTQPCLAGYTPGFGGAFNNVIWEVLCDLYISPLLVTLSVFEGHSTIAYVTEDILWYEW